MIKLVNASYKFSGQTGNNEFAIKNLSLKIERGEFVSLIGSNGCGKSTVAMILNGVYELESGYLEVDGKRVDDETDKLNARKKIGVLFQNPSEQLVAGSVEADVAFTLENFGIEVETIRERVDASLNLFNLNDVKSKHPRDLSGGEQQKVALAGVWALQPEYIICDELTTFLDPHYRKSVIKLLHGFVEKDGGVLFITQYPIESMNSDRLLVMKEGAIISEGNPETILRDSETMLKVNHSVPHEIIFEELTNNYSGRGI